ncbi:MAG: KEOPS complex subunit Pcc1 [Halobacteriota archaeon]
MISAIIIYEHPRASSLVDVLQPDNTPEIQMMAEENNVFVVLRVSKLRTLIASCDDLFANLQIAQTMLSDNEESTES